MKIIKTISHCLRINFRKLNNEMSGVSSLYWRTKKIIKFRMVHGYWPNLEHPDTFSEKLLKRIISDDDPDYDLYGMKHFAQYFVRLRNVPELKIAKQFKVTKCLQPSDFVDLPEAFVIKSSFGSGLNLVVLRKNELDIKKVCEHFNLKMKKIKNAQNKRCQNNYIIFEEFLGDPNTGTPNDYKFHCFNSIDEPFTCLIQVDSDRYGSHRQTIFDFNFSPLEMQFDRQVSHEIILKKPKSLEKMLRIAEKLSTGFDYIRIDLFEVEGEVFFGEITPFHQGAMAPITPLDWEYKVGKLWKQKVPYHAYGISEIPDVLDQNNVREM